MKVPSEMQWRKLLQFQIKSRIACSLKVEAGIIEFVFGYLSTGLECLINVCFKRYVCLNDGCGTLTNLEGGQHGLRVDGLKIVW